MRADPLIADPGLVLLPRSTIVALESAGGIELEAIARRLGLPSPSARMQPRECEELLMTALSDIGDPAFALITGARIRPELFGVVGLAAMVARSYGEALRRVARFSRLSSGAIVQLLPVAGGIALRRHSFRSALSAVERAHVDHELAWMVAFGRLLTEAPIAARRVALRGPAPTYAAAYRDVLGVVPQHDASHDEIVFDIADLERPLVSCSHEHSAYFLERAEQLLNECAAWSPVERVRATVSRLLEGRAPSIAQVARALSMSERSLQRQLAAAGTSYRVLLDGVRHTSICRALAAGETGLSALAERVGFSGAAALHRAFRRWEGITPRGYLARVHATLGRPDRAREWHPAAIGVGSRSSISA